MEKRWASIKLIGVLLYLGVMPLTPDAPLPVVFALFALAVAVPLLARLVHALLRQRFFAAVPRSVRASVAWGSGRQFRQATPGTRGTVRSRAPSLLAAAQG